MKIKELFNWQSINDLRVKLKNVKGESIIELLMFLKI